MPELPDLSVYQRAITKRAGNHELQRLQILNPFVLRSVEPVVAELAGRSLSGVERIGKQLVLCFSGDLFAVVHLMIAGRFQWLATGKAPPRGRTLAAWYFDTGTLILTEAGSKRRASVHLVAGRDQLTAFDRGGLEPLDISAGQLKDCLTQRNQTIKRALTDQRLMAGIGNAYSDEILWAARLSPYKGTTNLDEDQWLALHAAMQQTLIEWIERLQHAASKAWPKKVTAFHPQMAVHGKFGQPCPRCEAPVQRITYAEKNDANYCPGCQTGGKILADRMLSRLLKDSWPKTLDELES